MDIVQKIFAEVSNSQFKTIGSLDIQGEGGTQGTGKLDGRTVKVLQSTKGVGARVRQQLFEALTQKGAPNEYVKNLRKSLLGETEEEQNAVKDKPLSDRQIKEAIVYMRATPANVSKVLQNSLRASKFPDYAKELLQKTLVANANHPDVMAFLNGDETKTSREKYEQLCRVCALAAQLNQGQSEDAVAVAYLSGFAGDTQLTEAYEAEKHATDIGQSTLQPPEEPEPQPQPEPELKEQQKQKEELKTGKQTNPLEEPKTEKTPTNEVRKTQDVEYPETIYGQNPTEGAKVTVSSVINSSLEKFNLENTKKLTEAQKNHGQQFAKDALMKDGTLGEKCPQTGDKTEQQKNLGDFQKACRDVLTKALNNKSTEDVFGSADAFGFEIVVPDVDSAKTIGDLENEFMFVSNQVNEFLRTIKDETARKGLTDVLSKMVLELLRTLDKLEKLTSFKSKDVADDVAMFDRQRLSIKDVMSQHQIEATGAPDSGSVGTQVETRKIEDIDKAYKTVEPKVNSLLGKITDTVVADLAKPHLQNLVNDLKAALETLKLKKSTPLQPADTKAFDGIMSQIEALITQLEKAPEKKEKTSSNPVQPFSYDGTKDKEALTKYAEKDQKITDLWKQLVECDKAWKQHLDNGLYVLKNAKGNNCKPLHDAADKISKENTEVRNNLLNDIVNRTTQLLKGDSIDSKIETMAPQDERLKDLLKDFEARIDERTFSSGKCYTSEYKNALLEMFMKMPPSVLNLYQNTEIESAKAGVIDLIRALVGKEQFVQFGTNALNPGEDAKEPNFEIEKNQPQEPNGNTKYTWTATTITVSKPDPLVDFTPKVTQLLNNPGGGDCFLYAVINGLNDIDKDKKIAPSFENTREFRKAYCDHLKGLVDKFKAPKEEDRPTGFKVYGDTWMVARGKIFVDVKQAKVEYNHEDINLTNINQDHAMMDNSHGAFVADMLKRPVVIMGDDRMSGGLTLFDRDLATGRPLSGPPIILYYTRGLNGVGGHYQTARVDENTMKYIDDQLKANRS